MGRAALVPGLLGGLLAPAATAQNQLHHYDGTTNFTSRGSAPADSKVLLQRIPGDQACGTAQVSGAFFFIQDQDTATPESYQYQVRRSDSANPGQPDMTPSGLLGSSAVIPVQFPGTGIAAMSVTISFKPAIPVPSGAPGVPGGDFYAGIELPAAPLWTSDGISLHMSGGMGGPITPGEQQNPNAPGYTGIAGQAGLAWEFNLNPLSGPQGPNTVPNLPNRAWDLRTRFVEGVTQGFAWNPAVFTGTGNSTPGDPGLNPNFGYAGIWPDMLRVPGPDGFGFRFRLTAPAGSPACLLVGVSAEPAPIAIPGVFGSLCTVALFDLTLGPMLTVPAPGQPATTSEISFGPFAGSAAFVGATLRAQGFAIVGTDVVLGSMCTMFL